MSKKTEGVLLLDNIIRLQKPCLESYLVILSGKEKSGAIVGQIGLPNKKGFSQKH